MNWTKPSTRGKSDLNGKSNLTYSRSYFIINSAMRKFWYCFNTVNSYTFLFISLPKHNYFMNIIPPPYYKNLFGGFSCVEKLNRSFVLREMFHVALTELHCVLSNHFDGAGLIQ